MFDRDAKTVRQIAPLLKRVLIVDPHVANARLLGELVRDLIRSEVWAAPNAAKGLRLARTVNPDAIFVEQEAEDLDGLAFTRELRRSAYACRQAPVIVITPTPTPAGVLAARDAGVHEVLRRPYTLKDLLKRLEAVTLRPRDWVEAIDYIGPDRRRFNSGDYSGPLKRRSEIPDLPDAARSSQAAKILRSAVAAVDTDTFQAVRALKAQAVELMQCADRLGDARLARAVIEFGRYLEAAEGRGAFDKAELERVAAPLLAAVPREIAGAAA